VNPGGRSLLLASALLLVSCGGDFRPPALQTTGIPASELAQVIDVEVRLETFRLPGSTLAGLEMEIRFEFEEIGFGKLPARVFFGPARYDWTRTEVEVEDLGDGRTTVFVGDDRWTTGTLGPLRIENTLFEIVLDGDLSPGGRHLSGTAWDTLNGPGGTFEGWQRHRFLVAGTDFVSGTGYVSEVALVKESEIVVRNRLELVSSDSVLRVGSGAAFAINRFTFDNLQRLDPLSGFATAWQASIGAGSNPHDVAVLSDDKAYVTRYEPPFNDVAVFDPTLGRLLTSIPLDELAENPDGTPRPDHLRLAEGVLFVGLQDIDRTFSRFAEGKLAMIDTATDEVVGSIPLGGKNPGAIEAVRGADDRLRLYVALAGIFPGLQEQELSGGVAVVDVTQRVLERYALDDDVAGGNVGALAMVSDTLGYVVVSTEAFVNQILAFDPAAATVRRTVVERPEFVPEIEVDTGGLLAIPNRSFFEPGLCLYRIPESPEGHETFLGCGALDVPPFSIEALD
jgi:DNA-binding beta-propeller fold protein YncE